MNQALNIGIAGCGIGGMAAALFLSRAGHSVTIFDQFKTPAPLGSGLVIQPVGMDVLRALGLDQTVQGYGDKIYRMSGIEARSGRNVLHVDYGPKQGDTYGLGIHRGSLFAVLHTAILKDGINVQADCKITHSSITDSGRFLCAETGDNFGPFDLVIDASGAKSPISPIKARRLPYGALWGTVNWPDETTLPLGRLSQCYRAASHMLGVLPLGHITGDGSKKAAIFWSQKRDELPDWPKADLNAWKAQACQLWPEFSPFVSQIKTHSDMTPALYSHGTLRKPYAERIAYIGDAAHQASPQLGQGANMALLDAFALATALAQDGSTLDAMLKSYGRARRNHVLLYQYFSAVFTPFYQSKSRVLPVIRDNIMNPISRIWPVSALLTRLVCGNLIKP